MRTHYEAGGVGWLAELSTKKGTPASCLRELPILTNNSVSPNVKLFVEVDRKIELYAPNEWMTIYNGLIYHEKGCV